MSFGKRSTGEARSFAPKAEVVIRQRGGYPLGVLAVGGASYAGVVAMALLPYFNPTSRSLVELLPIATGPVLNAMGIAAVVLLVVDLMSRAVKYTGFRIYGLLSGGVMFLLCLGLLSLTGARFDIAVIVLVIPTAVGGGVLGLFRRRA